MYFNLYIFNPWKYWSLFFLSFFCWQVGGATPIMKQIPGRPLLTQTHLKSLSELQPFFNTLCHAGPSDGDYVVGKQKPGQYGAQNGVGQGLRKGIPKSKSFPAKIDKCQRTDSQLGAQQKTHRQIIEELVGRDFLEPCPLHWGGHWEPQGHWMEGPKVIECCQIGRWSSSRETNLKRDSLVTTGDDVDIKTITEALIRH